MGVAEPRPGAHKGDAEEGETAGGDEVEGCDGVELDAAALQRGSMGEDRGRKGECGRIKVMSGRINASASGAGLCHQPPAPHSTHSLPHPAMLACSRICTRVRRMDSVATLDICSTTPIQMKLISAGRQGAACHASGRVSKRASDSRQHRSASPGIGQRRFATRFVPQPCGARQQHCHQRCSPPYEAMAMPVPMTSMLRSRAAGPGQEGRAEGAMQVSRRSWRLLGIESSAVCPGEASSWLAGRQWATHGW